MIVRTGAWGDSDTLLYMIKGLDTIYSLRNFEISFITSEGRLPLQSIYSATKATSHWCSHSQSYVVDVVALRVECNSLT